MPFNTFSLTLKSIFFAHVKINDVVLSLLTNDQIKYNRQNFTFVFFHSDPQSSRPLGPATASYNSRAAQARRRQGPVAIKGKKDDPDDPANEGIEETNEDVLTQLRRSLHIEDFGCDNKAGSDAQNKNTETRKNEEYEDRGDETTQRDGELHGEGKSPGSNTSLTEAGEYLLVFPEDFPDMILLTCALYDKSCSILTNTSMQSVCSFSKRTRSASRRIKRFTLPPSMLPVHSQHSASCLVLVVRYTSQQHQRNSTVPNATS